MPRGAGARTRAIVVYYAFGHGVAFHGPLAVIYTLAVSRLSTTTSVAVAPVAGNRKMRDKAMACDALTKDDVSLPRLFGWEQGDCLSG